MFYAIVAKISPKRPKVIEPVKLANLLLDKVNGKIEDG